MNLNEFCDWTLSTDGWVNDINHLSQRMVINDFPTLKNVPEDLMSFKPDWSRLMLISSILSQATKRDHLEAALTIAQAGIILDTDNVVRDSAIVILNQLNNQRTANEAIRRQLVPADYQSRLGFSARMLSFREELEGKIFSAFGSPIAANRFQIEFWNEIDKSDWLYALAPTASGKSFIVFKYILEQIALKKAKLVIYIAPTRALVAEVEQNFRELSSEHGIKDISLSSVPINDLTHSTAPCIYIFTQERLQIFLNGLDNDTKIDILVVDEVQKLSDGMRGVILQDAIERVLQRANSTKLLFLSPNAENPEFLFKDSPSNVRTHIVDKDQPMVSQNILWASQSGSADTSEWKLELRCQNESKLLGYFNLVDRPTTIAKKLAFISVVLTGDNTGSMIYSNEPSEAENIAEFIAELLPYNNNEKLNYLSDLAKDGVHKNFKLVNTVKKGVAFHYGNMPSLLREEIETLFNTGDIRYLICTSTLIEGVNLSCKSIFVQGPKRGRSTPMDDQDFWNLAGRAGRWGKEFQGNIICIDPNIWKNQPPQRAKFVLKRQTDQVLSNSSTLLKYVKERSFSSKSIDTKDNLESVLAYLLNLNIRDSGLSTAQIRNNYDIDFISELNSNLSDLKGTIDIPANIIEKHSGISAVSMQTLLNYFRKDYGSGKKPIQNLIPLTPEADGAYFNMEGILRRIHYHLVPDFGFGKQYKHFAVLILNWMQGYTLKRLIESNIKQNLEASKTGKVKEKSIHTIIRDTMKEVEEYARFKAPKYISCYTDVLKFFLQELNQLQLYPKDYPFDLFLEFGVMSTTLLSLIGLGLSRMTATELGDVILSTDLDKEQTIQWLKLNLQDRDVPGFVKREVNKKLNI